jgi:zinc/manganese transport system substrate-binding protein
VAAVDEIAAAVTQATGLDVSADAEAYADQLSDVDVAIDQQLADIPDDRRVLITNHEVFGYFAERYGLEVVGVVVPGGTTLAEPSSEELSDLVDVIEEEDVPAIFADSSSSTDLADTLAAETGQDVEVVPLFSESLGEPGSGGETYLDLIQTNADRITNALS